MEFREFGNTGLRVSALGFGAMHVDGSGLSLAAQERLLGAVLDAGINLLDTARSYGHSEELIGRLVGHRRDEFVLSTKVGYGVEGIPDWTGPCITAGIDAALGRLRTDRIDIAHLHSCDSDVLTRGEVTGALVAAREAGKIRAAAYSGENDDLGTALETGCFDAIQTSVNLCDQRGLRTFVRRAGEHGLGVLAKRPVANAPWRFESQPHGHYCEPYWLRWQEMGPDLPRVDDWQDTALRFAAFAGGVHSCLVGTSSPDHLADNVRAVDRGPLPEEVTRAIHAAFDPHADEWAGEL